MVDLLKYVRGDGTPVGVTTNAGTAIHQCEVRTDLARWYQNKGSYSATGSNPADFEELGRSATHIYRGIDTSAQDGVLYELRDAPDLRGHKWCPIEMSVGQIYRRDAYVVKLNASGTVRSIQGPVPSWLKLEKVHTTWQGVRDVVQLAWYLDEACTQKEEDYYYGLNLGLVGYRDARGGFATPNFVWNARPPAPDVPVLVREPIAFALAPFIMPSADPPPLIPGIEGRIKTTSHVRLRRTPSLRAEILAELVSGTRVHYYPAPIKAEGKEWMEVRFGDITGYVALVWPTWEEQFSGQAPLPPVVLDLAAPYGDASVSLTSPFGERDDPLQPGPQADFHTGMDWAYLSPKPWDIVAAATGTVVKKERHAQYGNFLKIDHGNGLSTLYAHMETAGFPAIGQRVDKGEPIGLVGATGTVSGPHLHFEVRLNDVSVDPAPYLKAAPVPTPVNPCDDLQQRYEDLIAGIEAILDRR